MTAEELAIHRALRISQYPVLLADETKEPAEEHTLRTGSGNISVRPTSRSVHVSSFKEKQNNIKTLTS